MACEQMRPTLARDMGEQMQNVYTRIDEADFKMKASLASFENSFADLDLTGRVHRIETNSEQLIREMSVKAASTARDAVAATATQPLHGGLTRRDHPHLDPAALAS